MLVRFNSVHEYTSALLAAKAAQPESSFGGNWYDRSPSKSWDGGVSTLEATNRALNGDASLVAMATSAIDKIETTVEGNVRAQNEYSFSGSRVSVPSYLSGNPRAMVRRVKREMPTRSISIVVSTTCSGDIGADIMLKRGCTILALLELLQAQQIQVELSLLAETHGKTDGDLYQLIRIESKPLDLSTAAFAIAHPAFARNMTYAMSHHLDGFNGGWPKSRPFGGRSAMSVWYGNLRKTLGLTDSDLLIEGASSWDPLVARPEEWIKERMSQLTGSV